MTREIEKAAGIPVVQIATIVPIMMTVGANRIVPGVAIPHPVGAPQRELVMRALKAMQTSIDDQTIFED